MISPGDERLLRLRVLTMTEDLAGQPLKTGIVPIKPSQVRGVEAKLNATKVRRPFAGEAAEMNNLLRGGSTIKNYANAATKFEVQNFLLESFCRLVSQQTADRCGIIMGPAKQEESTLKKYWSGGTEAAGWVGEFKDLCRCTIVCYDENEYPLVPTKIRTELMNPCYAGKWIIVADPKASPGDTGKVRRRDDSNPEDLGYTDTNISLMLPNLAKVEVQVNIQSTLYGKMGRPAFLQEACPPGAGDTQYAALERTKRLPGGCGHVLYEVFKDLGKGRQCNMTIDQVRQLSRDYYDHLSGFRTSPNPENIVQRLVELSRSHLWAETYQKTSKDNRRNLPAFRPGTQWNVGDRV